MIRNRVRETTVSLGSGNLTLLGPVDPTYKTFYSAFGNNHFHYTITSGTQYEIGIGTLLNSTTLHRNTVFESSNSNNLVNFTSGVKQVFNSPPYHTLLDDTLTSYSGLIDLTIYKHHHIVLTLPNTQLTLLNPSHVQLFTVRLQQTTGNNLVTWWPDISWSGNTEPILTRSPDKSDMFIFSNISNAYLGFIVGFNI